MKNLQCDILIIGGGLTGLMTAYTLSELQKNIIIVDKNDFRQSRNNFVDLRTTAIAEGSKNFFEKIGIWRKLYKYAEPIKYIKVIDRTKLGEINFSNTNTHNFLGYIIKNFILKKIVIAELKKKKNVKILDNVNLHSLSSATDFIKSTLNKFNIKSKILIAADGKNSHVRSIIKTPIYFKKYNHDAMVINLNHSKDHKNIAHEIFLNTGPLAILPMKNKEKNIFSSTVIWSNNSKYVSSFSKINRDFMRSLMDEKISKYVGKVQKIIDIQTFNLSAHLNDKFYNDRLVYVGDSAHSIHPIAGQGWNLGIRDIQNLQSAIKNGLDLGLDIGNNVICKKYHDISFYDAYSLYQITDKLNSIFLDDRYIVNSLRRKGFNFIEKNKILKKYITNFAMGV